MSQSDRIADIEARTRDLLRRDPTTAAYLAESERRSAALPSAPVITPMSPGERPTEPGWYVVAGQSSGGPGPVVARIRSIAAPIDQDKAMVDFVGDGRLRLLSEETLTFIARIYPERIEGRAER